MIMPMGLVQFWLWNSYSFEVLQVTWKCYTSKFLSWPCNGTSIKSITIFIHSWSSVPWWKRVRKSKCCKLIEFSIYKPIFAWEIDWKWFQNDPTWFWPPFLMIGSVDEKESENWKYSKLVENHPIYQFWHEESIGNGFRMIRFLFLDHRLPR